MPNYHDNFEAGKVIVALNQNYAYPCAATRNASVFHGIEHTKVEVIFPSKESASDIGEIVLLHLVCQEKATVTNTVEKLSVHPHVAHAEPNFLFGRHIVPNDPYYGYLWGMETIKAPLAWNYATGSADIVVGVTDSGIDYNHPDINDNMWVSPSGYYGWNFINNDGESMDMTGHGTHVAGTIGAIGNNFIGIAGVCWNVKVASLRIGNTVFSLAAAIAAIDYANANNIPILNNSWGGRYYSPILKHTIEHYSGLFIASAGNDGANNDFFPDYPASFDNDNIISVAATNPDNTLASFSNYGARSVDIAAPGAAVFSLSLNGEYSYQDGTSMSAPHVAGAAALLKSYMPSLTVLDIKNIILASADKHPHLDDKILTSGILNVNAMFEMVNGFSMVVYTAVAGDSLWQIAAKHGVALNELIAANPQIANPNIIYPGQKINIPGK